jgi:hypothetical protein
MDDEEYKDKEEDETDEDNLHKHGFHLRKEGDLDDIGLNGGLEEEYDEEENELGDEEDEEEEEEY